MRLLLFASALVFLAAPALADPPEPDGGVTAAPDPSPERLIGQADQAVVFSHRAFDAAAVEVLSPIAALAFAPDFAEAAVRPYAASSRSPDREEGRPGDGAACVDRAPHVARLPVDPVAAGWLKVNDPTLVDVGKRSGRPAST